MRSVGSTVAALSGTAAVLSRRLLVFSLPLAAVMPTPPAAASRSLVREGMEAFAQNRVEESVQLYDRVIAEQPAAKPYLWQRGLALFYVDRFADGAEQFATDVAVNPNDTEESIWHLLCLARVKGGLQAARPYMLKVGTDRRPVMRSAQALFTGQAAEGELAAFAKSGVGDSFYANLYLGLYKEAMGDADSARLLIQQAATGPYRASGDPMVDVARVHLQRRGWVDPGPAGTASAARE